MDSHIYGVMNFAKANKLTIPTALLVMAAEDRGLPWSRANAPWHVVIGVGKKRIYFHDSWTSKTARHGMRICWNKHRTVNRLKARGLPVPLHLVTTSLDQAIEAATKIGFPVVIKPWVGAEGRGVSVNITDFPELESAFILAKEQSPTVLVERYISGNDYRLLVVNDKLVAAAQRLSARVCGDGKTSIRDLISYANSDVRRDWARKGILSRIRKNKDLYRMLHLQGYTLESVPRSGEEVILRSVSNVSAGGYSLEITEKVHPDNVKLAIKATKALGLRLAGVDFITPDITQSYKDVGGKIIEINSMPGLRIHATPREGTSKDVGGAIIDMLFPKSILEIQRSVNKFVMNTHAPVPPSAGTPHALRRGHKYLSN